MEKINCSKRQLSFDALKLITIFLVIWGHCVQHLLSSDYYEDTVYVVIYSFHMPLFFFIYPMGYIPYLTLLLLHAASSQLAWHVRGNK